MTQDDRVTAKSLISNAQVSMPNVNMTPMPDLAAPGAVLDGQSAAGFGGIDGQIGYPDVRSHRRKFGLLIPATNTSMEHELWTLLSGARSGGAMAGIGLHTANVMTPKPQLRSEADLVEYRNQFLGGLRTAVDQAKMAQPEYLIVGMSMEHVIKGLERVKAPMEEMDSYSLIPSAKWHEASDAALKCLGAKRIGLLTPFDRIGNENASQMFTDLGYQVATTFGFSCANALHIAHVPDWAKERAIVEHLARPENRLDAIVQCGTNMSLIDVTERLELRLGIPILGINATLLWYALRDTGIADPIPGGGRLLREF